jgi:hypothetical protein
MRRQIAAFERNWNYDAGYMRDLIDADPSAALAFGKVMGVSRYHKDVPLAPYFAAKIAATMAEDCGPCTQLVVDMAARAGVDPAILRAVVAGDVDAMQDDVALAVGFARASLAHAPEADDMREEIVRRWGKRALISLGFALVSARIFPTLKYALGHGQACMRITVAGETRPVLRAVSAERVTRMRAKHDGAVA